MILELCVTLPEALTILGLQVGDFIYVCHPASLWDSLYQAIVHQRDSVETAISLTQRELNTFMSGQE